ncbi:29 kDa ribonucleoprotein A, chloroplastic [Phoenix dactylifera]|uniref:29 kDa ribonucleoprotein A, chloroplastic n=1 Tax=Phoenix dactylifera TaxID=42345 RepID=A0A8B7BVL0_PHODC|nr:29 kDa ribonucleoprotein A, chloroplastic [Phoenix dactylifera]
MAAKAFVVCPNPRPEVFSRARKPGISHYTPALSFNTLFFPSRLRVSDSETSLRFRRCSVVQDIAAVEDEKKGDEKEEGRQENRQKLYVVNLPWNFLAPDIRKLFGECGTVESVEIIKQKNGKSRGFAFVMMASEEEALAAIDKLDSYELMGRIIRVEFAKSLRKPPSPPSPPGATAADTRQKIYVSNLSWKARSANLKEFFSAKFKPLSARVVFEDPSGRSAGYGFVAFATKEEADAAISELDGKELMGRPVRLRLRRKKGDESGSEPEESDNTEGQSNNS